MLPRPPDTAATTAAFQVMPPLSAEEYQALRADIAERGVLVPVVVDQHGRVLDGHHRQRIAAELGVECPAQVRQVADEADARDLAYRLNLLRRHLGPLAWAEAFRSLAEVRGVELDGKHNRHTARAVTVTALAEEVGVQPRTARRRLHLAAKLAGHPDLAAKVDTGEMEMRRAQRVVSEREAAWRRTETPAPPIDPDYRMECCDFRELDVADGVDLVLTDPPYLKATAGLWPELGKFAASVLRPGGLLVAYSGHTTFPEAFDGLREHLDYVWLGSLYMPGPNPWIRRYRLHTLSKPILLFANGPWTPRADKVYFDTLVSKQAEKSMHAWQQQLDPFVKLVDMFSEPGDLVVDPFLGSGTTALACQQLGRRFVGCDIDPAAVHVSRERLRNGEAV